MAVAVRTVVSALDRRAALSLAVGDSATCETLLHRAADARAHLVTAATTDARSARAREILECGGEDDAVEDNGDLSTECGSTADAERDHALDVKVRELIIRGDALRSGGRTAEAASVYQRAWVALERLRSVSSQAALCAASGGSMAAWDCENASDDSDSSKLLPTTPSDGTQQDATISDELSQFVAPVRWRQARCRELLGDEGGASVLYYDALARPGAPADHAVVRYRLGRAALARAARELPTGDADGRSALEVSRDHLSRAFALCGGGAVGGARGCVSAPPKLFRSICRSLAEASAAESSFVGAGSKSQSSSRPAASTTPALAAPRQRRRPAQAVADVGRDTTAADTSSNIGSASTDELMWRIGMLVYASIGGTMSSLLNARRSEAHTEEEVLRETAAVRAAAGSKSSDVSRRDDDDGDSDGDSDSDYESDSFVKGDGQRDAATAKRRQNVCGRLPPPDMSPGGALAIATARFHKAVRSLPESWTFCAICTAPPTTGAHVSRSSDGSNPGAGCGSLMLCRIEGGGRAPVTRFAAPLEKGIQQVGAVVPRTVAPPQPLRRALDELETVLAANVETLRGLGPDHPALRREELQGAAATTSLSPSDVCEGESCGPKARKGSKQKDIKEAKESKERKEYKKRWWAERHALDARLGALVGALERDTLGHLKALLVPPPADAAVVAALEAAASITVQEITSLESSVSTTDEQTCLAPPPTESSKPGHKKKGVRPCDGGDAVAETKHTGTDSAMANVDTELIRVCTLARENLSEEDWRDALSAALRCNRVSQHSLDLLAKGAHTRACAAYPGNSGAATVPTLEVDPLNVACMKNDSEDDAQTASASTSPDVSSQFKPPTVASLKQLKVAELREKLVALGQPSNGTKDVLIRRLCDAPPTPPPSPPPVANSQSCDAHASCSQRVISHQKSVANAGGSPVEPPDPPTKGKRHGSLVRAPLLLLPDETALALPWEGLNVLSGIAVSRAPSLAFVLAAARPLRARVKMATTTLSCGVKSVASATRLSSAARRVSARGVKYVVDPEANLPSTRAALAPALEARRRSLGWSGFAGMPPSSSAAQGHNSQSLDSQRGDDAAAANANFLASALSPPSVFLYCGHGAGETIFPRATVGASAPPGPRGACAVAVLMGCASGRWKARGALEPDGAVARYLLAGCPSVVCNLWDVTDKDIDRFTLALLDTWLPSGISAPTDGSLAESAAAPPPNNASPVMLAAAVAEARDEVKLKFLNGCAPVCWGVPTEAHTSVVPN